MANHHALVIGLDKGCDPHLQALRYACADAKAMHATFADTLGYGKGAHLLLQPSIQEVRQALKQIRAVVRAGDTLVAYFAGHGAQHGVDQYLLLHDANLRDLEAGDIAGNDLLSLRWLVNQVVDWPWVHAVFILDMCRTPLRSGARSGVGPATYSAQVQTVLAGIVARDMGFGAPSATHAQTATDQAAARPPPLVVNACADGQQAFELERLGRGQFSYSLERWLRSGQAQGQARVLGPQGVGEISRLLDETASQYEGPRGQRPWVPEQATDVVLWRPAVAPIKAAATVATSAAAAQRPEPQASAATQLSGLLARFELQLATGRLRSPAWDCCNGTLALLHHAGLEEGLLTLYEKRVAQAQQAAPVEKAQAKPPVAVVAPLASRPAGHVFRDADWAPQMVVIPAGRFVMGSPESEPGRFGDEGPQREVHIRQPFAMGRCVVTFDDYDRFAKATGTALPKDRGWGRASMPAIYVSWDDAQAYIRWLNAELGLKGPAGYRLPTEAEWEYAARAGSKTAFWWGNAISPTQANYAGNDVYVGGGQKGDYRAKTVKADAFEANAWGLYNVHGNVWEWVQDGWHASYSGAPPTGEEWKGNCTNARRVVRGGAWSGSPDLLRSAIRNRLAPDYRYINIGFRLARTF